MKTTFVIPMILLTFTVCCAQSFNDFIGYLYSLPDSLRPAAVDSFLNVNDEYPIVEYDTLAHFIYANTANSVSVPGDWNSWNSNADPMLNVPSTDFWYHTKIFESDARLDYKFVINGSTWMLDPLNPHVCYGGFGPNSELAMPQYVQPPEIVYYPEIPHGSIEDTLFYSNFLGNSRTIKIYLPPDYYSSTEMYPTMLFHDGLEYISLAYTNNILDYCIYHQLVDPLIAVFVPPVNRTEEYVGSLQDEFTLFILEELAPYINETYRVSGEAEDHAVLGPSYGGNISLHLGITASDDIKYVAPQSTYIEAQIFDSLEYGQMYDLDFHLIAGTYEPIILNPIENELIPLLDARGYSYEFDVYHEGHSWGLWRAHIDDALMRFFPGPNVEVRERGEVPVEFEMLRNYPNPFNQNTNLSFYLPVSGRVSLVVYNSLGREITCLAENFLNAGYYVESFDAVNLTSGVYFARLTAGNVYQTQKMIYLK